MTRTLRIDRDRLWAVTAGRIPLDHAHKLADAVLRLADQP